MQLATRTIRFRQSCLLILLSAVISHCGRTAAGGTARPTVQIMETDRHIEVDNGRIRFGLSRGTNATLEFVELAGRRPVDDNRAPLLSARLIESAVHDRLVDFIPSKTAHTAGYEITQLTFTHDAEHFRARMEGGLIFPGADRIDFTLYLDTAAGAPHLTTELELRPAGDFEQRYIRDIRLCLPLSLEWRKRIAQGGDQGLEWDTRYYYEFTERLGNILQDRNEWRYFAVEQDSPRQFRVWRSESDGTASLTHQHGQRAAGWTSVYDQHGGVLCGYKDMEAHAPKSIWVKAWGKGEIQVMIHPPSHPSFSPADAGAAANVFEPRHRMDWIFFEGEHPAAWPDDHLAGLWNKPAPLSGSRPARGFEDLADADIELWNAPAAQGADRPMVHGGLPMSRGAMQPGATARILQGRDALPTQMRPLAYWPDGSVKWLHVLFPLPAAATPDAMPAPAQGDDFVVTLRDGGHIPLTLEYGDIPPAASGNHTVRVERDGDTVRVDTGSLQLELGPGEQWLRQAHIGGRPLLRDDRERALAFVDFVRTTDTYPAGTAHITGQADAGPVLIDEIEIEETGPLRVVLLMRGRAMSQEPTGVILRLKAYAGSGEVRFFHTAVFDFNDPRQVFLSQMGLRLPLNLDARHTSLTAGGEQGPLAVDAGGAVSLRQFGPLHYRLLTLRDGAPATVHEGRRCRGWLDVSDGQGGVLAVVRHMWQDYPKEITFRPDTGDLEIFLWPAGARAMDVRRYSDFPHLAQGETVSADNRWVQSSFYPGDHVFVGIARTHEAALIFHDGSRQPAQKDTLAADIQSPPLIYAGYDSYREKDVAMALPEYARFPSIAAGLDNLVNFWLFHQRYWNWHGLWDYGDLQHRFRSGTYGNILDAARLIEILQIPRAQRTRQMTADHVRGDFMAQQDWLFDNGRWGWTNTEGLPGLFLQNEYLRTGRRDIYFAVEAIARHSRDVVTRHAGRYFGAGTRHGVQQWSCGHHGMRQTVFSEYRLHYYLSGESRSRDVMTRLVKEAYTRRRARKSADHAAIIYGIFTYWEMTGCPEIGALLRDYIHGFVVREGIDLEADIEITPEGVQVHASGGPRTNCTGMFGHNFGAMHGLLEYQHVTQDAKLRDGLVRMARAIGNPGRLGWTSKVIAFAARQADDPAPFREAIDTWIEQRGFETMLLPAASNPMHWTGETAFLAGGMPGSMMLANNLPVVLTALDREPEWTAAHHRHVARRENAERPDERRKPYFPRPSWQFEYDRPELADFFGPWRPPESAPGAGAALAGPADAIQAAFLTSDWTGIQVAEKRLAADGWRFRLDPENIGQSGGWHDPRHADHDWRTDIPIEKSWQLILDEPYYGVAWYRGRFDLPDAPGWTRILLDFRGVDEEALVWINGQLAGAHEQGPGGWNTPFLIDITAAVQEQASNQITVRIRNTAANGGIWQPVYVRTVK